MTEADKPKFLEMIMSLAALFSRDLDKAAIALYWDAVKDMSIESFRLAVKQAAATAEHFPPPAKLRPNEDYAEHRAAKAWLETLKLATRSSGDHSDPIAAEAIRMMGGGRTLGHTNREQLETWGRKRFVELYCDIAAQQARQPQSERLLVDNPIGEIE